MIIKRELLNVANEHNLSPQVIEKDYILGWLLAGIHNHPALTDSWVFKGGTCLKKCYFETYRFSEDLDFTLKDASHLNETFLYDIFGSIASWVYEQSGIELPTEKITFEVFQNPRNQTAMQGKIYYRGRIAPTSSKQLPRIKLDLTADEIIIESPIKNRVYHPYSDHPSEGIHIVGYSYVEVFAEKIRALAERTRPRDLYDVINFFRRPESLNLAHQVKSVLEKKCHFKSIPLPSLVELEKHKEECAAGWNDQLAHQLQSLPPFESFWDELPAFFDWLTQSPTYTQTALSYIPAKGISASIDAIQFNSASTHSVLDRIQFAAVNRLLVELSYQKENGEHSTYLIEPYSLRKTRRKDILLYAIKLPDNDIRGFRVDRILDAEITQRSFTPQYQIEFIPNSSIDIRALKRRRTNKFQY